MPKTTAGILLAFLVALSFGWLVSHGRGPNQLSRLNMLQAMVGEGRFVTDTLHSNTMDQALYEGHYYSDKPPAISYLALPAYTLAYGAMLAARISPVSVQGVGIGLWTATLATSVLYAALGAVCTWLVLLRFCRHPRMALLGTAGFWFGTLAFPYGTVLFSHTTTIGMLTIALAAALLPVPNVRKQSMTAEWLQSGTWIGIVAVIGIAFWVVLRLMNPATHPRILIFFLEVLSVAAALVFCCGVWNLLIGQGGGAGERRRRDMLAGLAIGTAVLGEYMAVIPAAVLLLLSWKREGFVPALRRAGWAALPMLLLPLTNWVCFGSPFMLGYSLSGFDWMNQGLYGVTASFHLSALAGLFFGPAKGMFFWSPVLMLSVPGFVELWRRDRALCIALASAALLTVLAVASTGNPGGGAAVGPRYAAPAVAMLALPMALGMEMIPLIGALLAGLSALLGLLTAVVSPTPPETMHFPLTQYYLPALLKGSLQSSFGSALGLPPLGALLPIACFWICVFAVLWKTAGAMRLNTDAA